MSSTRSAGMCLASLYDVPMSTVDWWFGSQGANQSIASNYLLLKNRKRMAVQHLRKTKARTIQTLVRRIV